MGGGQAPERLLDELRNFREFGEPRLRQLGGGTPAVHNEYWTSGQRQASSLHEVSYRACFKPQLPAFFIERCTQPGQVVYDPFSGRGTTALEAALLGRVPFANDVNPLSAMLLLPRLEPPDLAAIDRRLREIDLDRTGAVPEDLLVFFHDRTLRAICALREWLLGRERNGALDSVDRWIRMVATNRLTGHSNGFFSVYTLPPNQATTVAGQRRINEKRNQAPEPRDVAALILRKSRSLLADAGMFERQALAAVAPRAQLCTGPAAHTPQIPDGAVQLVVTSPPFLDIVQYASDNWLRCWFCGIDPASVAITMARTVEAWSAAMTEVFVELRRVVAPGGTIAFEVGEVRKGTVKLEEVVIPAAAAAGLHTECVLVNEQTFTKTANCWGVDNNEAGTNSNRIVVLRR